VKTNVVVWSVKDKNGLPFNAFCNNVLSEGNKIKMIIPTKYNGRGLAEATIFYKPVVCETKIKKK